MPRSTLTASITVPGTVKRIAVREWSLEVIAGPLKGLTAATAERLLRVGADVGNDLVLSDASVSRRHVEIERTDSGFLVRDLDSHNGTFIDGRRVLHAFALPGEKIAIGKTVLTIKRKTRDSQVEALDGSHFAGLDGESVEMRTVFAQLRKLAPSNLSVLIEGETGVGKELAATALHELSPRRDAPLEVIDCSLLTLANLQQQLHQRVALAAGGTVVLDEVGELATALQSRMLTLLDDASVRWVATTTHNLAADVAEGRFSEALRSRLAAANVRIPPLRARKGDLPLLVARLQLHNGPALEVTDDLLQLLNAHHWPGNVRELRNVVQRSALLQSTRGADLFDLVAPKATDKRIESLLALPYAPARDLVLSEFEKAYFSALVKSAGFSLTESARQAGLSSQSLYRLLQKNGIQLKKLKKSSTD